MPNSSDASQPMYAAVPTAAVASALMRPESSTSTNPTQNDSICSASVGIASRKIVRRRSPVSTSRLTSVGSLTDSDIELR